MKANGDKHDLELKTVIYATDFSLCSQNAGAYAVQLAAWFSASLLVVHVFTPSQAAMEVEVDEFRVSEQRKSLTSLLSAKASLLASGGIRTTPVLSEGDPKETVPTLADLHAPSLIVLGTHGGGRLERGIIGSVAEQILRSTSWPALTVGPAVPPASSTTFPLHRILFATDFTAAAAHAAAYASSFAKELGAEIDVLNVIPEDAIDHHDRLSDLQNRFFSVLDASLPREAREFSAPRTFVAVGNAHDQILEHIASRSIDLLVLGIRKTSHLGMEMRTSRAFKIIVDAECPVLTIRK